MKPNHLYIENDNMHTVCIKCNLSYDLKLPKCPHCDYYNSHYYTLTGASMGV